MTVKIMFRPHINAFSNIWRLVKLFNKEAVPELAKSLIEAKGARARTKTETMNRMLDVKTPSTSLKRMNCAINLTVGVCTRRIAYHLHRFVAIR